MTDAKTDKPSEPTAPEGKTVSLFPSKPPKGRHRNVPLEELKHISLAGAPTPPPSFVANVSAIGIQHALVLIETEKGVLRLQDGKRRLAAARELGLDAVPCLVHAESKLDGWKFAGPTLTLALNSQRSHNPAAEAQAIEKAIKAGASISDIARDTGMAVGTIKERLGTLTSLTPDLRKAFLSGKLKPSTAKAASKLSKRDQGKLATAVNRGDAVKLKDVSELRTVARTTAVSGLQLPDAPVTANAKAAWLEEAKASVQQLLLDSSPSMGLPKTVIASLKKALDGIETHLKTA